MKIDFSESHLRGVSRADALVIIFIASFAILGIWYYLIKAPWHHKRVRMRCAITLANMGERLQQFAADNRNLYPWMISTNVGGTLELRSRTDSAYLHFMSLSNFIPTPGSLLCKFDERQPANSWAAFENKNLSYFVGTGSNPQHSGSVVAGDRNIAWDNGKSSRTYWWDATLGLHGECGNLLLSDGSVLNTIKSNRLNKVFGTAVNRTNTVLIP